MRGLMVEEEEVRRNPSWLLQVLGPVMRRNSVEVIMAVVDNLLHRPKEVYRQALEPGGDYQVDLGHIGELTMMNWWVISCSSQVHMGGVWTWSVGLWVLRGSILSCRDPYLFQLNCLCMFLLPLVL